MKYDESLTYLTDDPKQAIKVIAENMLKVRPKVEVEYRPYTKSEIYYDKHLDMRIIDRKKLYPNSKPGDFVYIDTVVLACCESDAKLNFYGDAEVIKDGRVIYESSTSVLPNGRCSCPLHLRQGENPVRFKVKCNSNSEWIFKLMPSVKWYWVWAKCYLLSARLTSPIPCYRGEDGVGISRLYSDNDGDFDGVYAYPPLRTYDDRIDFNAVFPNSKGDFAYALTYAKSDSVLHIKGNAECFVNGSLKPSPVELKIGDTVIVRCKRSEGFSFDFSCGGIGIPFLKSSRGSGDKWLTLGTFDTEDLPKIQFTEPYSSADGRTFWKLARDDEYIRPYLPSRFFGQWHYTFMVGAFGLLNASRALEEERYRDYFCAHIELMIDYFDYMRYEHEIFSSPSFLDISSTLKDLDSIGSIGRNLCEYYKLTKNERALAVADVLLEAMKNNIPKFDDGTYHRRFDMWADDTFMSCPFLINAGTVKNDLSYHKEAVRQLLGFKKRLWMPEKKLFSHIYFLEEQKANLVPWGRGNGWVLISYSDALQNVSPDVSGYAELLETYREFVRGLCSVQDEDGLLHQVLDRPDSYAETSCTAMFIIGLCRGIRSGLIDGSYKQNVRRAYEGLLRYKIKADGTVTDVCMGSGNSKDAEYYMRLGTVENDDHGTGVILTALYEVINTL